MRQRDVDPYENRRRSLEPGADPGLRVLDQRVGIGPERPVRAGPRNTRLDPGVRLGCGALAALGRGQDADPATQRRVVRVVAVGCERPRIVDRRVDAKLTRLLVLEPHGIPSAIAPTGSVGLAAYPALNHRYRLQRKSSSRNFSRRHTKSRSEESRPAKE